LPPVAKKAGLAMTACRHTSYLAYLQHKR